MKMWFYKFGFFLYKMLVRPFKRTPMRWSAILFNKSGRFAVKHDDQGRSLPAGIGGDSRGLTSRGRSAAKAKTGENSRPIIGEDSTPAQSIASRNVCIGVLPKHQRP